MAIGLFKESGGIQYPMQALTDAGDHKIFSAAGVSIWSANEDRYPVVRPNGVISGLSLSPGLTNNTLSVTAGSVNLAGIKTSVSANTSLAVTRAVPTDTHIINAVTVTSGGSLAVVVGTESTSFSATWGAAGGPPLIPVGSVLVGLVYLSSSAAALVTASEIKAVSNIHREDAYYPNPSPKYIEGRLVFSQALLVCHTGDVTKAVYAEFYSPDFVEMEYIKPDSIQIPGETASVSSTEYNTGPIGLTTKSLSGGQFVQYLTQGGGRDPILDDSGSRLWFKFYPDVADVDVYSIFGGTLTVATNYGNKEATVSVASETSALRVVQ